MLVFYMLSTKKKV